MTKPPDTKAAEIRFGVELETFIPNASGIAVGGYHAGVNVISGVVSRNINTHVRNNIITVNAPMFDRSHWRADNDGSIRPDEDCRACEFVSPILQGDAGLENLVKMLVFINAIGGKVNNSCGCHITIGVRSVIGTDEPAALVEFSKKLANITLKHTKAIYAQTGTGRHENHYAHPLRPNTPKVFNKISRAGDAYAKTRLTCELGRGIINFQKLFTQGVVEFRAFAGTLNINKILHHLATCLALVRRASELQNPGGFRKTVKEQNGQKTATDALRYFWKFAGWTPGSGRDCALGLFGTLHAEFGSYRKAALEMAEKFEQRFPDCNL